MSHNGKGLPYGWWKSAAFWDAVIAGVLLVVLVLCILAWLYDWKPAW